MTNPELSSYIQNFLFENQDLKFREFHSKLVPSVDADSIIGVRTPALHKFAKELAKREDIDTFLEALPHQYFEENQLHAFILSNIKDFDEQVAAIETFLPYIDNWATCDQMSPKRMGKHQEETLALAKKWIQSNHPYTIRYGIGVLMSLFLDENFDEQYLDLVAGVASDEYYVNMMRAWYFAEAVAKQPEATVAYLRDNPLDPWTQNKAIQKARESFRVPQETKDYLQTLKVKK